MLLLRPLELIFRYIFPIATFKSYLFNRLLNYLREKQSEHTLWFSNSLPSAHNSQAPVRIPPWAWKLVQVSSPHRRTQALEVSPTASQAAHQWEAVTRGTTRTQTKVSDIHTLCACIPHGILTTMPNTRSPCAIPNCWSTQNSALSSCHTRHHLL